jgi:hypothetical protein
LKANKAQAQALVTLLNRLYAEIRVIEEAWDIRADAGDFRPRIEYFHDAVRALTAGLESKRLTVEFLAYDMSMLRHIQANPMAKPKGAKVTGSPGTAVIQRPEKGGVFHKPDSREAKFALADLYKHYAVIFVALLADSADRNYYTRLNNCNSQVEELAALEEAIKAASGKRDVPVNVQELADHAIDDPDLIRKLLSSLQGKRANRLLASEAQQSVKALMQLADKEIKTIDKAHFTFATSQLGVYENARDVVKNMAVQGMNIVGQFVQQAVQEASRKSGRGL